MLLPAFVRVHFGLPRVLCSLAFETCLAQQLSQPRENKKQQRLLRRMAFEKPTANLPEQQFCIELIPRYEYPFQGELPK